MSGIEEWLGSASTRQAAEESLWRLRRALERAGYDMRPATLAYRGSLLRALSDVGIGMDDEGVLRFRQYEDKAWQHPTGEEIKELPKPRAKQQPTSL